jgi:type VI secretion system secreted protein VgrG
MGADSPEALVVSPLGEGTLLLRRFEGAERLSAPFEYRLELLSPDWNIDFNRVLGQPMAVELLLHDGSERFLHGLVSRFEQQGTQAGTVAAARRLATYRATLVPWLWYLGRRADCRIYQEKPVREIVLDVFRRHGVADFELRLSGRYAPRLYCVQYRESDLAFVNRLLEEEGIYYFFQHARDKHTLVLCDSPAAHVPFPGAAEVPYRPDDAAGGLRLERVRQWSMQREVQSGWAAHNDFDFVHPRQIIHGDRKDPRQHERADLQRFDYPGGHMKYHRPLEDVAARFADAENLARVRQEEADAAHEVLAGAGDCRGLVPGHTFRLVDHPRDDQNREYLVTGARLRGVVAEFDSSAATPAGPAFVVEFTALAARTPYRPPRRTPRPLVEGPQTALVTGPAGEEIHTDKYGRVKVQFHWDREGTHDQNTSCWIRVAQSWAGKNWGAFYLPRVGQEVVVAFLEGDPDQPLITGGVYNGEQMPPYPLPADKTRSTLKSNSTPGSGGFNEIRFEDKKGQEEVFVHGQKDCDVRIENNTREWIGNDRHLIVKRDYYEHLEGDRHEQVAKCHFERIDIDRNLTVKKDDVIEIGGNQTVNVAKDVVWYVKQSQSLEVGKDLYIKARDIVIEAGVNVTIKVGGSFIAIEAGGIKIGTSGKIVLESGSTTEISGAAVKIN